MDDKRIWKDGLIAGLLLFVGYAFQTFGLKYTSVVSSGIITTEEMDWVANNQPDFSRLEKATALRLGRLLDRGLIQLGCRVR